MSSQYVSCDDSLLEKIQEEFESLNAVYEEDGITLEEPMLTEVRQAILEPKKTAQEKNTSELQEVNIKGKKAKVWRKKAAKSQQEESKAKAEAVEEKSIQVVQSVLKVLPSTGFNEAKVAVELVVKIFFRDKYPTVAPAFEIVNTRGLDDEQFEAITKQIQGLFKEHCNEEVDEEDCGILYNIYESLRDILSEYNDTVVGKCYICLCDFIDEEEMKTLDPAETKFTDRPDLARIDGCFHRFHLVCLHREWFMERHVEINEFGGKVVTLPPQQERCPVCRKLVSEADVKMVWDTYKANPSVEDNSYKNY